MNRVVLGSEQRIATVNGERLVGEQRAVRVRSVEVDGDRATAALAPGQTASLVRRDGDWLIERSTGAAPRASRLSDSSGRRRRPAPRSRHG